MADQSRMQDMAKLDVIVNNTRTRASMSNPVGTNWIEGSGVPVTGTPGATTTITAANILTGVITLSPSTACTATFDTAANVVLAVNQATAGAVVGDYLQCFIANGNATNAITLAGGTGATFDTNQATRVIPANTSKWVLIRLTNITAGSEAYIIYF